MDGDDDEARVGYGTAPAGGQPEGAGPLPGGDAITAGEMRALFGERVPLDAFRALFPDGDLAPAAGRPVEDVRRDLRAVAARAGRDEPAAEPVVEAAQWAARFVADAIEKSGRPKEPPAMAQHKFRIVCMDVLGKMHSDEPATRIAEVLIGGVYSGHVAFRHLRETIDRNQQLDAESRAFCHGLCVGFMVDLLPRLRG